MLIEEEKKKVFRNLEKLAIRDWAFINVGRIVMASESKNITSDMINSICFKLNIKPNRIYKVDLEKIIEYLKSAKNLS